MDESELRLHRCCFTGHRPEKLNLTEKEIVKKLEAAVIQAVEDGYTTFISGMARGVDLWAAQLVLHERAKNSNIKLIAAVPFPGFEKSWREEWQQQYNFIIEYADLVKYISGSYTGKDVFMKRNKWMVDRSGLVIAVYNGGSGGTKNTIEYAEEQMVECRMVYDLPDPSKDMLDRYSRLTFQ